MIPPNVLFISGGVGLGHVTRDLPIAAELRARCAGLRLRWLAPDPARRVLQAAGEELLPESQQYTGATTLLEKLAGPFSLNVANPACMLRSGARLKELVGYLRGCKTNLDIFKHVTERQRFDLVIGDETYDIGLATANNPALKRAPFAMIYDYVGVEVTSWNPLEWISVQITNWLWARHLGRVPAAHDLSLFVGEEQDVPDRPFGLFGPDRRTAPRAAMRYVGYVCPFDPDEYRDRASLRERLGYGPEPLVICSIGGTSTGKALLELCGRAYPLIKKELRGLRMVLVCGPRVSPDAPELAKGVDRRGYVHKLYEHLAACDLAIVQAGGTTTLELTALRRPFIYFPLAGHFEQQFDVTRRLERHAAGVRLEYRRTTPESLAAAVLANIGRELRYPPIATDGARNAAELLCEVIEARRAGAWQITTNRGQSTMALR